MNISTQDILDIVNVYVSDHDTIVLIEQDLKLYEKGQNAKPDSPAKRNSSELLGLHPRQMVERLNAP